MRDKSKHVYVSVIGTNKIGGSEGIYSKQVWCLHILEQLHHKTNSIRSRKMSFRKCIDTYPTRCR